MVQMAKGLLFGDYGDVVLGRVGHQVARLIGRHRAAGEGSHWRRRVGKGVLKIRRENIHLVSRQRANFALQKLHRRRRASRPVVTQPAMRHRRPVAQRSRQQHRVLPTATNQLLHSLCPVENSGRGLGDHSQSALPIWHDDVTFVVHRRVKCQVVLSQQRLSRRGLRPLQPDKRSILAHRSLAQAGLYQVFNGKLIFRILLRGDKESDAPNRNRLNGRALPWCGCQPQVGASGRARRGRLCIRACSGAQENQEDCYKTTAHQLNLDHM